MRTCVACSHVLYDAQLCEPCTMRCDRLSGQSRILFCRYDYFCTGSINKAVCMIKGSMQVSESRCLAGDRAGVVLVAASC